MVVVGFFVDEVDVSLFHGGGSWGRYGCVASSIVRSEDAVPFGQERFNSMLQVATSLEGGRRVVKGHRVGLGPGTSLIGVGESRR